MTSQTDDPERLDSLFREAVSAIDAGDAATLERLVARNPRLVRDRLEAPGAWLRDKCAAALESFFKQPYLLWFVCEDPARNTTLPRNVAHVARTLIQAIRREAADTLQEQLDFALHLALCSSVGRESGLQLQLIDELLDGGASPARHHGGAGGAPVQALICGNAAAAAHLLVRGIEVTLPAAVCLDRWDDVLRLAKDASPADKQVALSLAALNGKARGLIAMLELGVDLNAFSTGFYTHATPLHHAVCSGSLDAVKVLVEAGAELGTKDLAWQGSPLGWASYYRHEHRGDQRAARYAEIADYLREKGARED